jgi:hypothetical protein
MSRTMRKSYFYPRRKLVFRGGLQRVLKGQGWEFQSKSGLWLVCPKNCCIPGKSSKKRYGRIRRYNDKLVIEEELKDA